MIKYNLNELLNKEVIKKIFDIFNNESKEVRLVGGCVRDALLSRKSKDLDLNNQKNVKKFFKRNYFDLVILTAAKAGGIKAHIGNETEFLYENLMIALNVIKYSYENNIQKTKPWMN